MGFALGTCCNPVNLDCALHKELYQKRMGGVGDDYNRVYQNGVISRLNESMSYEF